MGTHTEEELEKRYRIIVLRFGKVIVTAQSKDKAAQKAIHLDEEGIHWLSDKDGIPGGRMVSLIELLDETIRIM